MSQGHAVYRQLIEEYGVLGPSEFRRHLSQLTGAGVLTVEDMEACAEYQDRLPPGSPKVPLGDAGSLDDEEEDDFFSMVDPP